VGGAVGALARVAIGVVVPVAASGWPWPTMIANLSGACLLGLLLGSLRDAATAGWWIRPFVATGVFGGYTTFSTLSVETLGLATTGRAPLAAAYALATTAGGLLAVWIGTAVALGLRRVRWGRR
jgi:fluoride exporter